MAEDGGLLIQQEAQPNQQETQNVSMKAYMSYTSLLVENNNIDDLAIVRAADLANSDKEQVIQLDDHNHVVRSTIWLINEETNDMGNWPAQNVEQPL
ncbi:hypothetical protein ACH5RR_030017 [Cinchona calisaya]|uniref:Uncharacterized protein n=1 Tax=Cinchona calisaya TaxID=153742 RepID=A0ABD2YUT3_9GENT